MKRAEQIAWAALAGLLTIMTILLIGGMMYHVTAFWAGGMLAGGQALVMGLAAWGLMLARQAAELRELSAPQSSQEKTDQAKSFRMSMGDDARRSDPVERQGGEAQTLDTTFQRLLAGSAGFILISMAAFVAWVVYAFCWFYRTHADVPVQLARDWNGKEIFLDELGLLIGVGSAFLYGVLYWVSRPKRGEERYAEANSSNFTMGITAAAALAVGTALAYLKVAYAAEVAACVIAFFMLLQGLELLVNSMRSYSAIEELDQDAVDLQALPLVPMLGSVWLSGLRMLFAASVGLSGKARSERGVIARMMPRTLAAIFIIAIGVSCLRVVQPGQVAVLERLGYAATDANGKLLPEAILQPGMHLTLPWPMDELVYIPTDQLQLTDVGTELHAPKEWGNKVDFQFWTIVDPSKAGDSEDEFITGDPGSAQLLETYVQVRWRVSDPLQFYTALSHSEFVEKAGTETKTLAIYEAIVQQCTSFAVTRTFAIHSLEQILISERTEVENHCKDILQAKLDHIHSGISVEMLTIKDLHPPYWRPDRYEASEDPIPSDQPNNRYSRGPASAFEFVVTMREYAEQLRNNALSYQIALVNLAKGQGEAAKAQAEAYRSDRVARANGEALRLVQMISGIAPQDQPFELGLLGQRMMYSSYEGLLNGVTKVVRDPDINVQVMQMTDKGLVPLSPSGR